MTVYILDNDPKRTAEYLDDKSLDSMIRDIAQVLCNVHHAELWRKNQSPEDRTINQISKDYHKLAVKIPIKIKQKNGQFDPWTNWARECKANYLYLVELGFHCLIEYEGRFGTYVSKDHPMEKVVIWARDNVPDLPLTKYLNGPKALEEHSTTPLPLVVPKKYHKLEYRASNPPQYVITDVGVINSYRNYYQAKLKTMKFRCSRKAKGKKSWCDPTVCSRWTNREKPNWLEL